MTVGVPHYLLETDVPARFKLSMHRDRIGDSESYRVHGSIPSLGLEEKLNAERRFAYVLLRKVISVHV